jgi:hypothetical protein
MQAVMPMDHVGEGMTRIAQCCCGALWAEASGDPALIAACHCEQCQRRTGSAFGVIAFFPVEQVRTQGRSNVFTREGQKGRKLRFHFCPNCGTTVFWEADFRPGQIGIAVGAFADSSFPAPTVSAWEQSKHPWINLRCELVQLPQQRS